MIAFDTPDADAPDATGPDTDAPDTDAPDSGASDTDAPDSGASDSGASEIASPGEPSWREEASKFEDEALIGLTDGDYSAAADNFLKALKLYESHKDEEAAICVAQYLGVALYESGQRENAVAIWEELLERHVNLPTVFGLLLQHYENSGEESEVQRIYQQFRGSGYGMGAAVPEPSAEPRVSIRIVVAEDDEALRTVLKRSLKRLGFDVHVAEDGEAALSAIHELRPDLALMDIYMPKQSGLDVLYRIRAAGLDTEVILISGIADSEMVKDSAVLGARFLKKPIKLEELEEAIMTQLEKRAGM